MYILAHAENLRSKFVAHSDKKSLEIHIGGSTGNISFSKFVQDMTDCMQSQITDPNLKEWIMPDFSTTTENDRVVASVAFMGSMSGYFDFGRRTGCGLPSVTLLGEREDWEIILDKAEKVKSLGDEPAQWYELLVPVIRSFIDTFRDPLSPKIKYFWACIAHDERGGSGQPDWYSGWITAFWFWTETGFCLYPQTERNPLSDRLTLDGVDYHRVKTDVLSHGWVKVSG